MLAARTPDLRLCSRGTFRDPRIGCGFARVRTRPYFSAMPDPHPVPSSNSVAALNRIITHGRRVLPLTLVLLALLVPRPGGLTAQEPDTITIDTIGPGALRPEPVPARTTTVDPVPAAEPVSPAGAFVRSLILPGWGQAYVGAPGRGSVYFALEAGSAWMTYKTWRQLGEARALQAWLRESGRLAPEEKLSVVDAREEQLEDWLTLSIFLLLFSGADAFVTAQLADFGEHVGVSPTAERGLRFEARFPLGRSR
jgi:hypothetical protein